MKKFITLLLCTIALGYTYAYAEMEAIRQKPTPTLYYAPYCPYSREVLAYLKTIQKKIPLKNVKQDLEAKEELKKVGGVLEVPCLIIGDQALYSSEVIIEWLKEHGNELDPL